MSKLAAALPTPETMTAIRLRRGPSGACDVYGDGDIEDWAAVERLRIGSTWGQAQAEVDRVLGVKPIDEGKFRYHWRLKCWHWTEDQRQAARELEL